MGKTMNSPAAKTACARRKPVAARRDKCISRSRCRSPIGLAVRTGRCRTLQASKLGVSRRLGESSGGSFRPETETRSCTEASTRPGTGGSPWNLCCLAPLRERRRTRAPRLRGRQRQARLDRMGADRLDQLAATWPTQGRSAPVGHPPRDQRSPRRRSIAKATIRRGQVSHDRQHGGSTNNRSRAENQTRRSLAAGSRIPNTAGPVTANSQQHQRRRHR